jgi:hypothetical protein
MNIKKIIDGFEQSQNDLNNKLSHLKICIDDEEKLWAEYEKLDRLFFLNDKALSFLGDSLQLVNKKDHLALVDLQEIKFIYQLLADFYPDNIQYQEDLIAFVYNVLDDEVEALLLIEKAERRLEVVLNSFAEIRREIKHK